jgi:thiol-disulfide isomerase/thioredoxin
MSKVHVHRLEKLDQAIARSRTEPGPTLFYFFGSKQSETGASWCPDCVLADPMVQQAVQRYCPDAMLVECPVGERAAWKANEEHPYRSHPLARLERIPTLIRCDRGLESGRLVEAACRDLQRLAAFLGTGME